MDEINSNFRNRKRLFLFSGIFLGIVVLVSGVSYGISWYRDPARQYARQQKIIEEAYRNDTYGGKTPQETLNMFIEALKAGDVELASKYFALDDNLSRKKWEDGLRQAKEEGRLKEMISTLDKAVGGDNGDDNFKESYFNFVVFGQNNEIQADINLEFSPITKVWKMSDL